MAMEAAVIGEPRRLGVAAVGETMGGSAIATLVVSGDESFISSN